ncbi:MAG: 7-cyano-7-deazaguanine synthase [Deltaproteobacteria bacterium]|nr:7-cyano-7-deazaguanine synthase [Deltaproteobacteria bacterium]
MPSRIAVLASGGLDSSVLLATLARRKRHVFPMYVRAGLRWEAEELLALRKFVKTLHGFRIAALEILDLPMADVAANHWSVTGRGVPGYRAATSSNYIVGRNLSLLVKAAVFCAHHRIGEIAMAPLGANPFPDARPQFFRAVERAIELGIGLPIKIRVPFVGLSKAQVIRRGRDLALGFTLSCARPRGLVHCGACTKCAERITAFRAAGVVDPTRYRAAR